MPFYKVDAWRDVVKKAWEKLNSGEFDSIKIVINSEETSENGLRLRIDTTTGGVGEETRFYFKNGVMTNSRDDSTLEI